MIQFATRSLFSFWPGACKSWARGDSTSLSMAIGFSWAASLAFTTTYIWTEWFPAWFVICLSSCVLASSFYCGIRTLLFGETIIKDSRPLRDQRLQQAQAAYLRGDYFESERLLASNLDLQPGDIESGLLLASVLRRTQRFDEAIDRLNLLRKRDFAIHWESELMVEKEKCLKRKGHS